MAFISDREIMKVREDKERDQRTIANLREKKEERTLTKKGVAALEAGGAAAVVGFVRGAVEKTGKPFAIPGTPVDVEALLVLGLIGSSMFRAWGSYNDDVLNAGLGVLGHYSGQMGRALGAGKRLSPVIGMLPEYVGRDAVGNLPTYVGRSGMPESELAAALAQSAT